MAKLTVVEEFDVAIKLAAKEAEKAPSRQVAETFYDSEPKFIEYFSKEWIVEKLAALVRKHRFKIQLDEDPQMMLLGFKPPRRIVLKTGEKISFGDATLRKIRQYRALLWKSNRDRKSPALEKIDKVIMLMQKYATKDHGITFTEAVAREAAKRR